VSYLLVTRAKSRHIALYSEAPGSTQITLFRKSTTTGMPHTYSTWGRQVKKTTLSHKFLFFLSKYEKKSGNKMDSFNLAMIFGPNILQKRKINSNREYSIDKNALVDDIDSVIAMTKYLIENQKYLFYVSIKVCIN
jgi:hypothetical protein